MSLPSVTCPECGAPLKPGASACSACLLSAGAATQPVEPVGAGVATLPCVMGDYTLLRKLGAGGMGIVYEADHGPSGRRLALKVLNQSLDHEEQRQRFLREGRLAATIDHPHSVYVFGTEEIDGIPVIAMELAAGGTLRDEVRRRGPLPVREAVDAILGIIDGLEAAHARGILHRDMKPSNCFLTGEGKAMVGDYGLSISHTQDEAEIDAGPLTRSGMVMGTPAFSPPEQLRAQPLDLRADIYSTGGTLYYLLTGKAPVERTTPVETVAAVLEGRVPSVRTLRPEVPQDLAAVIARCLAPQAAARFTSYAELRLALLPFSSTAAEPAPLGLRVMAGLADGALLSALLFLAVWVWPRLGPLWLGDEPNSTALWLYTAVMIGLYAVAESRWGTTPGKVLFGLRVVGADGARPSWQRAAVRAGLFAAVPLLAEELTGWLGAAAGLEHGSAAMLAVAVLQVCASFVHVLLFLPALRRPDRAGLHDLLTDMRVILKRQGKARLGAPDSLPPPAQAAGEMWGPFQAGVVVGSESLRLGHDPLLRRAVLLRARGAEGGPAMARRDCARAGRLRWLQAVTDTTGRPWDVWQAPAGSPLMAVLAQGAPRWHDLVGWLDDLAAELSAAEKDGTLPAELSLWQVWITTDGRALLLDEAWPGTSPTQVFPTTPDAKAAAQRFLGPVADLCPAVLRPLHADAVLASLKQAAFERLSHLSGNLQHLRHKKSDVSRVSRTASVVGPFLTVAGMLAVAFVAFDAMQKNIWTTAYPGLPPLPQVLAIHHRFVTEGEGKEPALAGQIRTHLAGHYSSLVEDEERARAMFLGRADLKQLRSLLHAQPPPDAATLEAADAAVKEMARAFPGTGEVSKIEWQKAAPVMVMMGLMLTAVLQLVQVLATGKPLLMGLAGVAAVTEDQRPARRARMLWRWCLGWAPLWVVSIILVACGAAGLPVRRLLGEICLVWAPACLLLIIVALLIPRRSLVDRLAGTWLVVR